MAESKREKFQIAGSRATEYDLPEDMKHLKNMTTINDLTDDQIMNELSKK